MYEGLTQHDLKQLFNNSLLLYKGKPTKVRAIGEDRVFRLFDLSSQKAFTEKNPCENFQAPVLRIGMINIGGSVLYLDRRPLRQYIIGFCTENTRFSGLRVEYPELGMAETQRKAMLLEDKSIAEAMVGNYPTLKECLDGVKQFGGAMAFDHQFAVDAERRIFYRTLCVGKIPQRCSTVEKIEFIPNFRYLKSFWRVCMKKIYALLGLSSPNPNDVGIEIECEGRNLVVIDEENSKYWKTVPDGSLRGAFPEQSAEWVMRSPVKQKDVKAALTELVAVQKNATFAFSYRTSVHVHINVQDLTKLQLLNMVYLYLLLEEPLMNYCGKERKGNRFCLRLADAEAMLESITKWVANSFESIRTLPEGQRYSAINLASLRKYGSVEFRGMRGTIDQGVIQNWVNILVSIREFAKTAKSPQEIYEAFCNMGAKEFAKTLFGDLYPIFEYPRMEQEMCRSFSLSIDIPALFNRVGARFTEEEPERKVKDVVKEFDMEAVLAQVRVNAAARAIPRPRIRPVPILPPEDGMEFNVDFPEPEAP